MGEMVEAGSNYSLFLLILRASYGSVIEIYPNKYPQFILLPPSFIHSIDNSLKRMKSFLQWIALFLLGTAGKWEHFPLYTDLTDKFMFPEITEAVPRLFLWEQPLHYGRICEV
jgi:hypothetical protein